MTTHLLLHDLFEDVSIDCERVVAIGSEFAEDVLWIVGVWMAQVDFCEDDGGGWGGVCEVFEEVSEWVEGGGAFWVWVRWRGISA